MAVTGIDIGGTKLSGAIFSERGQILFRQSHKLEHRTGDEVGALIQQLVGELFEEAGNQSVNINAVGICVPGISYHQTGCAWVPNIPGWENYPVKQKIEEVVPHDCRIVVDSDRACAILGESWTGAAKGCKDAIFLAVGTGIGAGILVNGQILRGAHDIGGAIGWWALDRPYMEKYTPCGCFEYHASGEGLAKVARELLENQKEYNGVLRSKPLEQVTAYDLFEVFKTKDSIATQTFDIAIQFWGMTVANLVSIFDPEKIIFGGGVFGPATIFLDDIYREAKKHAQPISIQKVTLEASQLGGEAVLIGAGYMALNASSQTANHIKAV
jgi:glucokinase